jgi:hypothetical protein
MFVDVVFTVNDIVPYNINIPDIEIDEFASESVC